MAQALALKYRPKSFDDLCEQKAVVQILQNQIDTNTIQHGYLFTGPAGCGKTTSARIFADMINKGEGVPTELDAASNNSVDDIRRLIEDAQTQSLVGEYKVFIIDECHMITTAGFNAFLKTLEEPPAKSIFIMCTTNPEKLPATILSRVQQYHFQKISTAGIVNRLQYIVDSEFGSGAPVSEDALDYIARLADGGMRDAITLLDKCLSYSETLTLDIVIEALNTVDYNTILKINEHIFNRVIPDIINDIDEVYRSGIDMKQFIKSYFETVLDMNILSITGGIAKFPEFVLKEMREYTSYEWDTLMRLMDMLLELQSTIRYEHNPRAVIIAKFIQFIGVEESDRAK